MKQQVNIRLDDYHKHLAIKHSKRFKECPRPDCGSVTYGIEKALEATETDKGAPDES